ncbi:MAG: DUF1569 domain-containing protein [Flavobacteriaceae bacterium]
MKSIFNASAYNEILDRIELLNEDSAGQWGKMDVAQMLSHCQKPLAVALGRKSLKKPNVFMKLVLRSFKSAMYNDRPWKKNMETVPEYLVDSKQDFSNEKNALKEILSDFYELRTREKWDPHPSFGHFTHDQWGMLQYKHLDHHLKQFGV